MAKPDFAEKTYENPLYQELTNIPGTYCPSQPLENKLGFDASLLVTNDLFWEHIGYQTNLRGAILKDFKTNRFNINANDDSSLFELKHNLFIQAKRADYLFGHTKKTYDIDPSTNYYRFKIDKHQQQVLERLQDLLGKSRALVTYAAPCFHTTKELTDCIISETIFLKSNFVKAGKLKNHNHWTYVFPGASGIGRSKKTKIIDTDLIYTLLGYNQDNNKEIFNISDNCDLVYRKIKQIIEEFDIYYLDYEFKRIEKILFDNIFYKEDIKKDEYNLLKHYFLSKVFTEYYDIEWLLI